MYDVIVCGAGPAGSSCARELALKGLSVKLLEADDFPRDKACGGGLRASLAKENDYIRKGLDGIDSVEASAFVFHSKDLRHSAHLTGVGPIVHGVRRLDFDRMMADAASDAGAELSTGQRVKEVKPLKDQVVASTGKREWSARTVVGACGMYDPVAKLIRSRNSLPTSWEKGKIGLVVVEEFPVDEGFITERYGGNYTHHVFLSYDGLKGYAWVFPKRGYLNIGYGAFWNVMKGLDIRKEFGSFIGYLRSRDLVPEGLSPGKFKGAPLPLRGPISRTYGDRAIIIGDAAGFVSPLAGDGIYYAIESGKMAAGALTQLLEKDRVGQEDTKLYQDTWTWRWKQEFSALVDIADKVMAHTDRVIKYASMDEQLLHEIGLMAAGSGDPAKKKGWFYRRVLRDLVRHDLLGMKL